MDKKRLAQYSKNTVVYGSQGVRPVYQATEPKQDMAWAYVVAVVGVVILAGLVAWMVYYG